jgi:competence ComEA-like helix-hairpin-helix protein
MLGVMTMKKILKLMMLIVFTICLTFSSFALDATQSLKMLQTELQSQNLVVSNFTLATASELLANGDIENAFNAITEEIVARTISSSYQKYGIELNPVDLQKSVEKIMASKGAEINSALSTFQKLYSEEKTEASVDESQNQNDEATQSEEASSNSGNEQPSTDNAQADDQSGVTDNSSQPTEEAVSAEEAVETVNENETVKEAAESSVEQTNVDVAEQVKAAVASLVSLQAEVEAAAEVEAKSIAEGLDEENSKSQIVSELKDYFLNNSKDIANYVKDFAYNSLKESGINSTDAKSYADAVKSGVLTVSDVMKGKDIDDAILKNKSGFEKLLTTGIKTLAIKKGVSKSDATKLGKEISTASFQIAKFLMSSDNVKESFLENESEIAGLLKTTAENCLKQLGYDDDLAKSVGYGSKSIVKMSADVLAGKSATEIFVSNSADIAMAAGQLTKYVGQNWDGDLTNAAYNGVKSTIKIGAALADGKSVKDAFIKGSGELSTAAGYLTKYLTDDVLGASSYDATTYKYAADLGVDVVADYLKTGSAKDAYLENSDKVNDVVSRLTKMIAQNTGKMSAGDADILKNSVSSLMGIVTDSVEGGSISDALKNNKKDVQKALSDIIATTLNKNVKININTAGIDELVKLEGIGESKAEEIIAYREANGNFGSLEDITKVKGIGQSTYLKNKENMTLEGGSSSLLNAEDILTIVNGGKFDFAKDAEYNYDNKWNYNKNDGYLTEGSSSKPSDFTVVNLLDKDFKAELLNLEGSVEGSNEALGLSYSAEGSIEASAKGEISADLGKFSYKGTDGKYHTIYGAKAEGEISAKIEAEGSAGASLEKNIGGVDVTAFAQANGKAEIGAEASGVAYAGIVDGKGAAIHAEGEAFIGAKAEGEVSAGISAAGITGTVGATGNIGVGLGVSGVFDVQIGWSGIKWNVGAEAYVGIGGGIHTQGELDFSGVYDWVADKADDAFDAVKNVATKTWDTITGWFK